MARTKLKYVIGIDEAGRGPLAGPVAVGVVKIKNENLNSKEVGRVWFKGLKDSKKLSEGKREEWFAKIKKARRAGWLDHAVAFSSARTIDKRGIVFAIEDAIRRALLKLRARPAESMALLDGGLKAPEAYRSQITIIKGDEKEPVIALASIAAKVLRDRLMKKMADKHPQYDFEKHKGYGTRGHYRKISKHGLSDIHRRSFLRGKS